MASCVAPAFTLLSNDHDLAFGVDRTGVEFVTEQVHPQSVGPRVPAALRVAAVNPESL